MIEIILITGMIGILLLANSAKDDETYPWMTKAEVAEWFADMTGSTNPQEHINHLRCAAGKWMRTTTAKFAFCTLDDLITEGFGVPAYFVQRDGWESKKVLITKELEGGNWNLISAGAIRNLEGMLRHAFVESDYEMFRIEKDGTIGWWSPNPDYVKDEHRLESIQITFDRKKKGHDGTENTAPYTLDSKKGLVLNLVPAA